MVPTTTSLAGDASAPDTPHASLRLLPIKRSGGVLLWLFNWFMRTSFGKVMMPARVIYSRWPTLFWRQLGLYHLTQYGLTIGQDLKHLIEVLASENNQCSFCLDLHKASAHKAKVTKQKLAALAEFETAPVFSEAERVALRYVSEITKTGRASDENFNALKAHFSESQIIEITWLQAFTTYLNRMAVPLGIGSDGYCELMGTDS